MSANLSPEYKKAVHGTCNCRTAGGRVQIAISRRIHWLTTVLAFQEGFVAAIEAGDGLAAALHTPR